MADVTFSSIHVISGQELGETPQVFVQPGGKRTPRVGETLVVFLDLPNAPASVYSDIARTISDAYWRAPGGLTTALRLSIKLANDRLIETNRGAPATQRVEGSISCAVVNDESVVIAQAGPAIAFARAQSGAFERVIPDGDMPRVGKDHAVESFFTHFAYSVGDNFVLTGNGSCARVTDELVNACMGKGDAHLVAGYLNANIKDGRMVGVAFTLGRPAPVSAGVTVPAPERSTPAQVATNTPSKTQSTRTPATTVAPRQPSQAAHALATATAAAGSMLNHARQSVQRSLRQFGGQLLPASVSQATPTQRSRATTFGLASIAILLPIAVALIVSLLYFQLSGEADKQQLRNQTRTQLELAKASNNKVEWTKALGLISDYDAKYPDDPATFGQDKVQARGQLDGINKVTRVAPTTLTTVNVTQAPLRIAASGMGVYVLDPSTNSVEYHALNSQRNGITGRPVPLTPSAGNPINTPMSDITWATTSGERWRYDGTLVFGKTTLYEYNSATNQMIALPLPTDANSAPSQPVAGELYNNTAYILDSGIGQIWRYTLQQGKMVRADPYFRSAFRQLTESIDFAIDGSIYLLQKSGMVLKYFNRQPVSFTVDLNALPEPMGQVTAIAINGSDSRAGSVFIADAGKGAVWQFTKTGQYIKQYRGVNEEFAGLTDMSLDPTTNTLYLIVADKLYSFKVN